MDEFEQTVSDYLDSLGQEPHASRNLDRVGSDFNVLYNAELIKRDPERLERVKAYAEVKRLEAIRKWSREIAETEGVMSKIDCFLFDHGMSKQQEVKTTNDD